MTAALVALVIGKAALLAALGWLAWAHERDSGWDAFHLVPVVAAGTLIVSMLDATPLHAGVRIATPFIVAAACMAIGGLLTKIRTVSTDALLLMILVATVSLIVFDAVSAYTPQTAASMPSATILVLSVATLAMLALTWASNKKTRLLALGEANRWAMRYWRGEPGRAPFFGIAAATYLCWVVTLAVPLQSTGVLSSTIFKNVVFGVLVARVASVRGVPVLLATSATLALLVTITGFTFTNRYTPMVVEAATLVALFLWARQRTERTQWLNIHAR